MILVTHLTCEYRANPLGIDVTAPRLSWQLQSKRRGLRQSTYRILAASGAEQLTEGAADLWDSGRVESDQSILVAYAGKPLSSRQRVHWKVLIWDEKGDAFHSETA